jgi:hypothetical protein
VFLFPIVIVIIIIPTLVYPIIIKDGYLGSAPRIEHLPILYIVSIIVKGNYLKLEARLKKAPAVLYIVLAIIKDSYLFSTSIDSYIALLV